MYRSVSGAIFSADANIQDIQSVTGCKVNCRITEFSSVKQWEEEIELNVGADLLAAFVVAQQATETQTEVYTYDGNNFIADAGGFLGLLLGFSIADAADLVARLFVRKRAPATKKVTSRAVIPGKF